MMMSGTSTPVEARDGKIIAIKGIASVPTPVNPHLDMPRTRAQMHAKTQFHPPNW